MRRLLVALAVAGLVASGAGAVAQASGLDDTRPALGTVLTPDQVGITQPGQGFFPFFVGAGGQNGSNLGGIGLAGAAPTALGTSALFSGFGGCGVFSISFCPFFSAAPFSQTFLLANGGSLGLGSPLQGLGLNNLAFGANAVPGGNVGQLSAQAVPGTGNLFGTTLGLNNGLFGLGGLGTGLGFGAGFGTGLGAGFGGLNCAPQGAFLVCQ
ncbi:MAG TPA: hypothetical protein VFE37_10295 [Chloroflexota bacterium]|nr:hypothetical protein [Chloroflexota bacterium]